MRTVIIFFFGFITLFAHAETDNGIAPLVELGIATYAQAIDLDQNGHFDELAAFDYDNSSIKLFDSNGSLYQEIQIDRLVHGLNINRFFLTDYNHDGTVDIISYSTGDNKLSLLAGSKAENKKIIFKPKEVIAVKTPGPPKKMVTYKVIVSDVNKDGVNDVLLHLGKKGKDYQISQMFLLPILSERNHYTTFSPQQIPLDCEEINLASFISQDTEISCRNDEEIDFYKFDFKQSGNIELTPQKTYSFRESVQDGNFRIPSGESLELLHDHMDRIGFRVTSSATRDINLDGRMDFIFTYNYDYYHYLHILTYDVKRGIFFNYLSNHLIAQQTEGPFSYDTIANFLEEDRAEEIYKTFSKTFNYKIEEGTGIIQFLDGPKRPKYPSKTPPSAKNYIPLFSNHSVAKIIWLSRYGGFCRDLYAPHPEQSFCIYENTISDMVNSDDYNSLSKALELSLGWKLFKVKEEFANHYFSEIVKSRRLSVAKWLLALGANPNGPENLSGAQQFPLYSAVKNDDKDMVELLLEAGANKDYGAEMYSRSLLSLVISEYSSDSILYYYGKIKGFYDLSSYFGEGLLQVLTFTNEGKLFELRSILHDVLVGNQFKINGPLESYMVKMADDTLFKMKYDPEVNCIGSSSFTFHMRSANPNKQKRYIDIFKHIENTKCFNYWERTRHGTLLGAIVKWGNDLIGEFIVNRHDFPEGLANRYYEQIMRNNELEMPKTLAALRTKGAEWDKPKYFITSRNSEYLERYFDQTKHCITAQDFFEYRHDISNDIQVLNFIENSYCFDYFLKFSYHRDYFDGTLLDLFILENNDILAKHFLEKAKPDLQEDPEYYKRNYQRIIRNHASKFPKTQKYLESLLRN